MSHVETAQRSTHGSFVLFIGNFLSAAVSYIAILFIARLLGPSNYGVYALCIVLPNLLLNFLGLGVSSAITRYAAYDLSQGDEDAARRMTLVGASFVIFSGVALSLLDLLIAGPVAASLFHRPDITPFLEFSSSFVLAQAVFQSGVSALLGWRYMGKIAGATIAQSVLRLAIAVPLIIVGYSVYGALIGYFVSVLLGGVLAFGLLWKGTGGLRTLQRQYVTDVKVLISYGREFFVGSIASNFSPQYVITILAVFASNAYIGYYQSASNFVTAITLTSGAITQALFPAFAHLQGRGADLRLAFKYAVKYMGFAITPIIFLLMGASLQTIQVSLGSAYAPAAGFLALLAFSNISMLFGAGVLPSFFNGLGKPRYYMLSSLAGAAVLLPLTPILSISAGFGIPGVIASILAANMVAVAAGLYLAVRYFEARVDLSACASILASSVVAYAAIVALSRTHVRDLFLLPAEILVYAFVYLTAAPLLRAIGPGDLETLGSAFGGLGRFGVFLKPLLDYERLILRASRLDRTVGEGHIASDG